jgi:hypothetical protein
MFKVDVEIRLDQLAPHDPSHLVAVEFDDGLGALDLGHICHPRMRRDGLPGRVSVWGGK